MASRVGLEPTTHRLTVAYPDDFTVYDWRVCAEVGRTYRSWLGFSDELWNEYEHFRGVVIAETPKGLSLRDRDRFLIARSIRKGIEQDCIL